MCQQRIILRALQSIYKIMYFDSAVVVYYREFETAKTVVIDKTLLNSINTEYA